MLTKTMIKYLLVIAFTSTAIFIPIGDFYLGFSYITIVLLWILLLITKNLKFPKYITKFIIVFSLYSIIQSFIKGFPLQNVIISTLGLIMYSSGLFSVFKLYENKNTFLINIYLKIAFYASIFAVFQELSFLFKFSFDFSWFFNGYSEYTFSGPFLKVPSFFTEPGYFAPFLIPAVYISLKKIIRPSIDFPLINAIIIILALLLTFSAIGYAGLFFCFFFLFRKKIVLGMITGIFFVMLTMLYVPSINSRVITFLNFTSLINVQEANSSSLIVLLNYNIAKNSFKENPLLGTGIDSYESMSKTIIKNEINNEVLTQFINIMPLNDLNTKEGSNLLFRTLVEFGFVGFVGIIIFLKKFLLFDEENQTIQYMCLAFVLSYSLRTGQYLRFELWFFIILFQSIYIENKHKINHSKKIRTIN